MPARFPRVTEARSPSAGHTIRIYNKGRQTLPLQVAPPGSDFYLNEQQVHLAPGKSVELPKDQVRMDQVQNLAARGLLRVTYDSEALADAGQK